MRVFQNSSVSYPAAAAMLARLMADKPTFAGKIAAFHQDGFDASHTLAPVLTGVGHAFYTHGDNAALQRTWAEENGLPAATGLEDILLAQIEQHRTEVFYNLDIVTYDSRFLKRLPGSVKARIGWHAAPPTGRDLTGYLMVCNFPSILDAWRKNGLRAAYFTPSHLTALDSRALNDRRDIDVLFVGSYSRHHARRAAVLEAVAGLSDRYEIVFAIAGSRLNRLAETPLGSFGPLRQYRRPEAVSRIARPPVFGNAYYDLLGRTKIMLNGAIDMAGNDRGNMRCWETLGTRALLVSDDGNYPAGMVDGATIRTYKSPEHAVEIIETSLANDSERRRIAGAGYEMIRTRHSKAAQWDQFQRIVTENF
jgi:hypothetical protein